jgi:hypothetical protein
MKDESGHFGGELSSPYSGRTDLTPEGVQHLEERFQGATVATPVQYLSPELVAGPSGWKSIPGAVRFAVWLWAIATIIGFVVGAVLVLLALISGTWVLSQM